MATDFGYRLTSSGRDILVSVKLNSARVQVTRTEVNFGVDFRQRYQEGNG